VPLLATHFTQKYARPGESPKQIAPDAMELLVSHSWPGNIRELENAMERACVTCRDQQIRIENLPPDLSRQPKPTSSFPIDLSRPLGEHLQQATAQIEREYLVRALKETRGHIGECARICGLSRRSVAAKVSEYQLDKGAFKSGKSRN